MNRIHIDPQTGLPALPKGYYWYVSEASKPIEEGLDGYHTIELRRESTFPIPFMRIDLWEEISFIRRGELTMEKLVETTYQILEEKSNPWIKFWETKELREQSKLAGAYR